jgi:hypothetical protein
MFPVNCFATLACRCGRAWIFTHQRTNSYYLAFNTAKAGVRIFRAPLGKYDEHGRHVAPLRVALPFQTVETVNESAQYRQRSLQLGPSFRDEQWQNRLIWGDKKYVLPSRLPEFAGKVSLIYIDPPFDNRRGLLIHGDSAR